MCPCSYHTQMFTAVLNIINESTEREMPWIISLTCRSLKSPTHRSKQENPGHSLQSGKPMGRRRALMGGCGASVRHAEQIIVFYYIK